LCGALLATASYTRACTDEDITPSDTTIDYKVSSFLYLHNGKTNNWLQHNIGISYVLRNSGDDDREWIYHEYGGAISEMDILRGPKPKKPIS